MTIQGKLCLYLRKQLTIFLRVQVMDCSLSAGLCQILSRVTDELNKLKRDNHTILSTRRLSKYSYTRYTSSSKYTLDIVYCEIKVYLRRVCDNHFLRITCPE